MKTICNIFWFIFGGFAVAGFFLLGGLLLCATIIGIPFGVQCFKVARVTAWPYGTDVDLEWSEHKISNTLWALTFGWATCLSALAIAVVFCITIIGIPIGLQVMKLAKLFLFPFGADIR